MADKVAKTANKKIEEDHPSKKISTDLPSSIKEQATGNVMPPDLNEFMENGNEPMGSGIMSDRHRSQMANRMNESQQLVKQTGK